MSPCLRALYATTLAVVPRARAVAVPFPPLAASAWLRIVRSKPSVRERQLSPFQTHPDTGPSARRRSHLRTAIGRSSTSTLSPKATSSASARALSLSCALRQG